jgi:UDP-glucose 4-epimerase
MMNRIPELAGGLLVTGVSGFVGSEIVRQALDDGVDASAPDEQSVNLLDPASLVGACRGMEAVIHAAGLAHIFDKQRAAAAPFKQINEEGTANLVRAAVDAGVRHLVLISSVSVYRSGAGRGSDETAPCEPGGAYARSKYGAELRALEITAGSDTRLTILRLATVYGEGDPGNVGRLMRAIDRGRFLWVGSGRNCKSLIHRSDVATAALIAMASPLTSAPVSPRLYTVSAPPRTMREIVDTLARHLGRRPPRLGFPGGVSLGAAALASAICLGRGPAATLHGVIRKWLQNDLYPAELITRELGFQPAIDLDEGLGREVAAYRREQGKAGR